MRWGRRAGLSPGGRAWPAGGRGSAKMRLQLGGGVVGAIEPRTGLHKHVHLRANTVTAAWWLLGSSGPAGVEITGHRPGWGRGQVSKESADWQKGKPSAGVTGEEGGGGVARGSSP